MSPRQEVYNLFLTILHPHISVHILPTVVDTFPKVLTRRILSAIKSFLSW